jgi:hypothetical protein
MLDVQARQFVTTETTPETEQEEGAIAGTKQRFRLASTGGGGRNRIIQPVCNLGDLFELERPRLPFLRGMKRANAFQHLTLKGKGYLLERPDQEPSPIRMAPFPSQGPVRTAAMARAIFAAPMLDGSIGLA